MSIIWEVRESDAEFFLALCKQMDAENKFMMLEPQGSLVDYLTAIGGSFARNKHEAYLHRGGTS